MNPADVAGDLLDAQGDFVGFHRCPMLRHVLYQTYADAAHPAGVEQFLVRRGADGLGAREIIPAGAAVRRPDAGWTPITRPIDCSEGRGLEL